LPNFHRRLLSDGSGLYTRTPPREEIGAADSKKLNRQVGRIGDVHIVGREFAGDSRHCGNASRAQFHAVERREFVGILFDCASPAGRQPARVDLASYHPNLLQV
jgi:hypothetical protein